MQRGVNGARDGNGEPGHGLKRITRGGKHRVGRSEVLHQEPLACRADAGECIQDGFRELAIAALAVWCVIAKR